MALSRGQMAQLKHVMAAGSPSPEKAQQSMVRKKWASKSLSFSVHWTQPPSTTVQAIKSPFHDENCWLDSEANLSKRAG